MNTSLPNNPQFNKYYEKHGKYLRLKGLQPKTIEAYSRAIRRIGNYFDCRIDNLTSDQLLDYFNELLDSHSWSAVKLDLYGLKFFYTNVLKKTWEDIPLIKPPKGTRIPDILTIEQANQLFAATNKLSYKVFFFTIYSMGLRLGEGIRLTVGDIDAINMRVHIRNAKGNKDRLVPLPEKTLKKGTGALYSLCLTAKFHPKRAAGFDIHGDLHVRNRHVMNRNQSWREKERFWEKQPGSGSARDRPVPVGPGPRYLLVFDF